MPRVLAPTVVVVALVTLLASAALDRTAGPSAAPEGRVVPVHHNSAIAVVTVRGVELVDPTMGARQLLPQVRWTLGRSAYEVSQTL